MPILIIFTKRITSAVSVECENVHLLYQIKCPIWFIREFFHRTLYLRLNFEDPNVLFLLALGKKAKIYVFGLADLQCTMYIGMCGWPNRK